jgi:hypothetical protein
LLGKLNDEQIEEVLKTNLLGRIGCHADDLNPRYNSSMGRSAGGKNCGSPSKR